MKTLVVQLARMKFCSVSDKPGRREEDAGREPGESVQSFRAWTCASFYATLTAEFEIPSRFMNQQQSSATTLYSGMG